MRAAQDAQVMPPISSSVVCASSPVVRIVRSAPGERVAGLVDGGGDRLVVHGGLAGDGQGAGLEVDLDLGDTGDGGDLLGDRVNAVRAGHAGDGVGGGAHGFLSDGGQDRTRRAMASAASRTFSSASGPPAWAAETTQWDRCSSSRPRATDCSAFVIAETWVRMSMQYFSSSTMRCRPRAWPSMRRSRVR